jgi:hypothetical protein
MKIHLRIDESNPTHTRFTVFANGANCGTLVLRTDEFFHFHQIVGMGCCKDIDEFISTGTPWTEEKGE